MPASQRSDLRDLIRRIEEVRGLSDLPPLDLQRSGSVETLLEASEALLHEVERHRRRMIETTILLAALSELLSSVLESDEPTPALTSLCMFLRGAFRADWVYIGLEEERHGKLTGPLVHRDIGGEIVDSTLELVIDGGQEPLRTVLTEHQVWRFGGRDASAAFEAPGAGRLLAIACLPIGRLPSRVPPCSLPPRPTHNRSGGPHAGEVRGVLVVGRYREELFEDDHVALLESLGVSIGTALENSRLTRRVVEELRFRDNVLESMVDGLIAVDARRRVQAMNEVAAALLGLDRGAIMGQELPEGLLVDGELEADPLTLALAPDAVTTRGEGWLHPPAHERRPVRIATTQLRDADGKLNGALLTFFDLTHIREMERRLRHLDRIAALGRFTSSVAHEIRNPLAGIAAGIEYLGRGIDADDPRRQHLDFVMREVGRLDRIVGDLSRATRPREPQPRELDVTTLIEDAVKGVRGRPEAAECRIETKSAGGLPPAYVDPDHLEQVLVNLILNAAQAGGEGPVVVRAWSTPPATGRGSTLWISVEDSGPGVDADNIDRVFEPFFTTKKEGTGLGLYICHEMVKRNGGEITVRNIPSGGAQFLLELPAVAAKAA